MPRFVTQDAFHSVLATKCRGMELVVLELGEVPSGGPPGGWGRFAKETQPFYLDSIASRDCSA